VPLTLPSHTTILTGLLPPQHGVRDNGIDQPDATHPNRRYAAERRGYRHGRVRRRVRARLAASASRADSTCYDDQITRDPNATERLEAERPASVVVDRALAWLKVWDQGQDGRRTTDQGPTAHGPFFRVDPSLRSARPYDPPAGVAVHTKSRYDAEIAYTDAQVARVLTVAARRCAEDRHVVIVAGDHGEGSAITASGRTACCCTTRRCGAVDRRDAGRKGRSSDLRRSALPTSRRRCFARRA
jgi:arylsulfatase A-like enzyme